MTLGTLATTFPRLFHICPRGLGDTFRTAGLLSARQLFEKFADHDGFVEWSWDSCPNWKKSKWRELNGMHRTDAIRLRRTDLGEMQIRDQRPLGNLEALEQNCLTGMTGTQWIQLLNDRVYLFPSNRKENTLCAAGNAFRKSYGCNVTIVAVFETKRLGTLADRIELSPINGGAINGVARRGPGTYRPLESIQKEDLCNVKEFTVRGGIEPDDLLHACISPWVQQVDCPDRAETGERFGPYPKQL